MLFAQNTNFEETGRVSILNTKILLAPGVGFEPTTNWLHLSTNFLMGWTISSSSKGCEALPASVLAEEVLHNG